MGYDGRSVLRAAGAAKDTSVRDIHLLLADKYAELTKRESVLEPFWNVRAA
jgi:hypothetical protein